MRARLVWPPLVALLALGLVAPPAHAGPRTGIVAVDAPTAVAQGAKLTIAARVRGPIAATRWAVVLERRAQAKRVALTPVEAAVTGRGARALNAVVPSRTTRGAYRLVVCLRGRAARRITRRRRCAKGPVVLVRRRVAAPASAPAVMPPSPAPAPPAPAPVEPAAPPQPEPTRCPEPGVPPPTPEDTPPTGDYRVSGYTPQAAGGLPWKWTNVRPLDPPDRELDENGAAVFRTQGEPCPHPAFLAQYALHLVNDYRVTGEQGYLDRAIANAEKMLTTGVRRDGALYLAYRFRHPQGGGPDDVMVPPWYSAMAQGQALSVLVRLAQATGDTRWLDLADQVFLSFTQPRAEGVPWCVWVDDEGNLWLEEYANHQPMRVLNGHIAALYGIYDYALETDSAVARTLYDGALTTVRDRIGDFRVPGGLSLYDLRIRNSYLDYHEEHTRMLRMLFRLSRDDFFDQWATTFEEDQRAYESR